MKFFVKLASMLSVGLLTTSVYAAGLYRDFSIEQLSCDFEDESIDVYAYESNDDMTTLNAFVDGIRVEGEFVSREEKGSLVLVKDGRDVFAIHGLRDMTSLNLNGEVVFEALDKTLFGREFKIAPYFCEVD